MDDPLQGGVPNIPLGDIEMPRDPSAGRGEYDDILDQSIGDVRRDLIAPVSVERARSIVSPDDESAPIGQSLGRATFAGVDPPPPPHLPSIPASAGAAQRPTTEERSPEDAPIGGGLAAAKPPPSRLMPADVAIPLSTDPPDPDVEMPPPWAGAANPADDKPLHEGVRLPQPPANEDAPIGGLDATTLERVKGSGSPFHASMKELMRLDEARSEDQRRHRRGNILRAIGTLAGVAGLGSGSSGLAGIGAALAQGGNSLRESNRAEDESARIEARMRGDQGQLAYNTQQQERADSMRRQDAEATRQAAQDDLARRTAEAEIGLTQARTRSEEAEAIQTEFDRLQASGDVEGTRALIRATVSGLNDNSGLVQMWRQAIASGSLDQMDAAALEDFQSLIGQLVNNRQAGLLTRGGGRGSGTTYYNPETRTFMTRGGGGRAPAEPRPIGTPEEEAALAAGQAPPVPASGAAPRRAPRHGRGSGGRAGSAPRAPGAPSEEFVALPSEDDLLVRALETSGLNLDSPEGQAALQFHRMQLHSRDAAARTATRTMMGDMLARGANADGLPGWADRREWNARLAPSRPITNRLHVLARLDSLLSRSSQEQVMAALHGGPGMARIAGAAELRSAIADQMNKYFHEMGGAAISPSEAARYGTAWGSDSVVTDPSVFRAAVNRMIDQNADELAVIWNDLGNPDYLELYYQRVVHPHRR